MEQQNISLWIATTTSPEFDAFRDSLSVDVVIIGAGITGLTAAMILKERGKRVAVIERERVGSGETGNTTAHLTEAVDHRFHAIAREFDKDTARLVAEASRTAIEQISAFVERFSIDCGFKRVPGYLYTEKRNYVAELKREAIAAADAGLAVKFTAEVPLPFPTRGAVLFPNQAQFHPRRYLIALASRFRGDGCFIFDNTYVSEVKEGDPCVVRTGSGEITAGAIFMATNVPISGFNTLHLKDAAYRTYALGYHVEGAYPEGLFWDTADPYHYTRWQETDRGTFMIVGGEDHKVGQEADTEACFERLQQYTLEHFGSHPLRYRWSGQVINPVDGLPYIGGDTSGKLFVSTGYAGQGMTFGTLGGMIVADLITGRENKFAGKFDWKRIHARGAVKDFITENKDFAKHIVADRVLRRNVESKHTVDVKEGEGRIISIDGRKIAAYRDAGGQLYTVSPVCTHMKCDVAFNATEKTWDCPCHGSRFKVDGTTLNGPARDPLAKIDLTEE